MFRKSTLIISALSMVAVPVAADAHHYRYGGYDQGYAGYQQGYGSYDQGYANYQQGYGNYGQGYDGRYAQMGYYPQQAYGYQNAYYGDYGYRRHRCSGTTGTIVGAGAGALLGRSIGRGSGYYHQHSGTTGAIIGAALGAIVGREVGKGTC